MKFIILLSLNIFSLATLLFAFGCSNDGAKTPPTNLSQKEVTPIDKSISDNKDLTVLRASISPEPTAPVTFLVGDDLGLFRKHGIKLEMTGNIPVSQLVAAVVGGQLDVSHGAHINRTIAGISAGAKILAVVGNTETTKVYPHMVGVVKKNSPLRKPEDFVGKKIGLSKVGGCHEYTPYAWLEQNGIKDPKSKVEITIINLTVLEQALRQGEIDLAMLHKTPEEIKRNDEFDIIFSDYDVWGTDGGATPNYFSAKFIKDNPKVVRNFVTAVAETLDWMNANLQGAREITARRTNQDVNKLSSNYYSPSGIIKPVEAKLWIDLLERFGEIKPGLTPEDIFTNDFNPYYK
ncbi:MAG: ABC transporter substrate-binding protein [Deltaproteobacteria bacterium]|jgi:ABC-type nitrate/sulfonate/bicarbonate transport system substrate-binding protein|nr:ABC transporter substrate-binding protein [Deltaproteobacteria bacterium]